MARERIAVAEDLALVVFQQQIVTLASHKRFRLDWDLPDPKQLDDAGFRDVRDRIETLVRDLVARAGEGS